MEPADIKKDISHANECELAEVDADGKVQGGLEGLTIDDVLPKLDRPWYRVAHLRHLNFVILAVLLTPATNGFDGSMMNGLQTLPIWQKGEHAMDMCLLLHLLNYDVQTSIILKVAFLVCLAPLTPLASSLHCPSPDGLPTSSVANVRYRLEM